VSYIGDPFTHDLFVTYSHGTIPGEALSPLKRWSDGFIRELERELKVNPKYTRTLKIFFDDHQQSDQSLNPNAGLTEQLRDEIGRSALLQVLMSEQYLASDWCREEREWWLARQTALGLTAQDRIAVARILPTTAKWPPVVADERGNPFVGTCFFDEAGPALAVRPHAWPLPNWDTRDPFRKLLLEVVGWLTQRIEFMKTRMDERRAAAAEAAKLADETGQVLYLHGRAEHESVWQAAKGALEERGFTVFPSEPEDVATDPVTAQRKQALRIETMGACDALLLVGTTDAPAVDADLVVVGRGDRQLARARTNRYLPCGLVDTAGAPLATTARRRAARALQVDWIDGTRPPWPTDVQRWLTDKSAAARPR
jgi:hypothetical protein